jgi:RNA polymerase sigma-70 factor (ECF subfamily)
VRERDFERLYRKSYGLVYGYIRSRVSCDADAEDVVAEAYMKAARAFASFDPKRAQFTTWVVAIARNCLSSHFRKVRPTTTLDDVPESIAAVPGEQDAVADRDLATRLLAVLDDLECEIVLLKYRDGMRNVDIASCLDMNASTVSTKLAKALAKMRAETERTA